MDLGGAARQFKDGSELQVPAVAACSSPGGRSEDGFLTEGEPGQRSRRFHGVVCGRCEVGETEACLGAIYQGGGGGVEGSAQMETTAEGVEMSRLERRVLPIVGESDHLLLGAVVAGCHHLGHEHVGRCGAAHRAYEEELVPLGGAAVVGDSARRAEHERFCDEGRGGDLVVTAVASDLAAHTADGPGGGRCHLSVVAFCSGEEVLRQRCILRVPLLRHHVERETVVFGKASELAGDEAVIVELGDEIFLPASGAEHQRVRRHILVAVLLALFACRRARLGEMNDIATSALHHW